MRKKPKSMIIECIYCNKKMRHNNLSRHLRIKHGYDKFNNPSEEYFIRYISPNSKGLCLNCFTPTKFISIMSGYKNYCCKVCADKSDLVKQHREETFLKKYNVHTVSKLEITKEKQQEANNKRSKQEWHEIYKKKQQTKLKKYGDENYMIYGSNSYNERLLQKYKDKNYMKFGSSSYKEYMDNKECKGDPYNRDKDVCINKRKQTCILKYGVDNPSKDKQIYQKSINTKLKKYGKIINYNGKASKISKKVFDILSKEYNIIYDDHPKEYYLRIQDKLYFLDCLQKDTKKVIEVYGDYWHGNPAIYRSNDYITFPNNKTILVENIWSDDKLRIKNIEKEGYDVLVIWETEINNQFEETIKKCKLFLNKEK